MSRASQPQPDKQQAASPTTTPAAAPAARRKHPWLLALAILLLGAWLAFLALMAFGLR